MTSFRLLLWCMLMEFGALLLEFPLLQQRILKRASLIIDIAHLLVRLAAEIQQLIGLETAVQFVRLNFTVSIVEVVFDIAVEGSPFRTVFAFEYRDFEAGFALALAEVFSGDEVEGWFIESPWGGCCKDQRSQSRGNGDDGSELHAFGEVDLI